MTAHVFIVDYITFKIHLEYLFAGTGAKNHIIDFNNKHTSNLSPNTEKNLVAMMSDISRIRKNDYIIFYLQQKIKKGIKEGKFFGIFQAAKDISFIDNNDGDQYLKEMLQKSLTFRILIKPYQIYQDGVTEWEALDEIRNIQSPSQMLWSLIYRKLKANRGNTMITIYESERLFQLIRNKNKRTFLSQDAHSFSFDIDNQKIITIERENIDYEGRKENINIFPRLKNKYIRNQSFEPHLQLYICQNIGRNTNSSLDNLLLSNNELEWIGNEVSCGVGMQRIDILLSLKNKSQRMLLPIELKAVRSEENNLKQIQRYIEWIRQYYIPNHPSDIQPVLITKGGRLPINSLKEFNNSNQNDCKPLKHIEIIIDNDEIIFDEIVY